jgi:hypothetical protein
MPRTALVMEEEEEGVGLNLVEPLRLIAHLSGFRLWAGRTAGLGPVVSRVIHIIQPSRRGKIYLSIGIKNKKYLTGILSHSN